jgi:hypothetical protein
MNDSASTLVVDRGSQPPSLSPDTFAQDRAQVVAVHRKWWKANVGLDIPSMRECFPSGNAFTMYNRNSFTYFGIEELTALWQWFRDTGAPARLTQTVAIMRIEVRADTAWVISELQYKRSTPRPSDWENADVDSTFGSKATEIYHRDDGNGNPRWTMWHFQSAVLQPVNKPRDPFNDVLTQRGLGGSPLGEPLVYTVTLDNPPK